MARFDHTTVLPPWSVPTDRSGDALLTIAAHAVPSGGVVVAVSGEVDMTVCPLLRDRLIQYLRSTCQLVLDLSGVTFLGAAGLTVLVVVSEAALATGAALCVVARPRPVLLPLLITGLADVLDLHADVAGALSCPLLPAGTRLGGPRQPGDLR